MEISQIYCIYLYLSIFLSNNLSTSLSICISIYLIYLSILRVLSLALYLSLSLLLIHAHFPLLIVSSYCLFFSLILYFLLYIFHFSCFSSSSQRQDIAARAAAPRGPADGGIGADSRLDSLGVCALPLFVSARSQVTCAGFSKI